MGSSGDGSGPNMRVVEVMNFLAAHPTESFTLSELASHLDLSVGSAHRLLTTLAEARFLSRHPKRKTYSLGMALVAIGQAALVQHRHIDIAKREMVSLASDLKLECHACAVVQDELLYLASEGVPQSYEPLSHVGDRRPYIPPLGIVHAAWATPDEQEDYVARAPAPLSEAARNHVAHSLGVIRERGYAMSGSGTAFRALRQFTIAPVGYQRDEAYWAGIRQLLADLTERELQLLDFDDAGPDGVSSITAPVFSASGQVSLEISLGGLPTNLKRDEFDRCVERLRVTAAVVTREIHGRKPSDPGDVGLVPASFGRRGRASKRLSPA